ncbi:MAG: YbhB/YbcL family Raf kinase inhibitor-like protein [Spirochaetales bacterium]
MAMETITVESGAFEHQGPIPAKYTCDGANASPALSWTGAPEATKSYALIVDDPDAPGKTFVHWVYYDIPESVASLPEGVPAVDRPSQGGTQGVNDFGKAGFGGPCPPGGTHRYFFKVYALDTRLGLVAGATKQEVVTAMETHVLAQGTLMGTYGRK